MGESGKVDGEVGADGEGYRAVGADAVLQESIEASGKKKEPPVIAAFEKLALLGT